MKIKQKYKSLLFLTKEQIQEMNTMLIDGESAATVAATIKNLWGQCPDVTDEALRKQLSRYRSEELMPASNPTKTEATVYTNTLSELLQLIPMQKKRLMKIYDKEEQLPVLDREVSAEIAQYMKMLTEAAKLETQQYLHSGATLACVATAIDKTHALLPGANGKCPSPQSLT